MLLPQLQGLKQRLTFPTLIVDEQGRASQVLRLGLVLRDVGTGRTSSRSLLYEGVQVGQVWVLVSLLVLGWSILRLKHHSGALGHHHTHREMKEILETQKTQLYKNHCYFSDHLIHFSMHFLNALVSLLLRIIGS